jgi:hypothetical protein
MLCVSRMSPWRTAVTAMIVRQADRLDAGCLEK